MVLCSAVILRVRLVALVLALSVVSLCGMWLVQRASAETSKQVTQEKAPSLGSLDTKKNLPGIAKPLIGGPGNPSRGQLIFSDQKSGPCSFCHKVTRLGEDVIQGTVGPALDNVAARYSKAQLRQIIVDPKVYFPGSIMPSYYSPDQDLHRVEGRFLNKTILTARELEHVVAFLRTLRE